jgi:hypothetical protein
MATVVNASEAVALVRSGDRVFVHTAATAPQRLVAVLERFRRLP